MGAHQNRDSEKVTIRWPSRTGRYLAEYVPSMRPPHRNTGLIDELAHLPGVIGVRTLDNLKGLHISAVTRNSTAGRYVYNAVYAAFKRHGYELIESDESQERSK